MKLFHKYREVWDKKNDELYIMVDDDFVVTKSSSVKDLSDMNPMYDTDYVDNSSDNFLYYLKFERPIRHIEKKQLYLFKKNKLYEYNKNQWNDELGNIIDDYNDIWYEPFVFVYEKDLHQVKRALKLRKLNEFTCL